MPSAAFLALSKNARHAYKSRPIHNILLHPGAQQNLGDEHCTFIIPLLFRPPQDDGSESHIRTWAYFELDPENNESWIHVQDPQERIKQRNTRNPRKPLQSPWKPEHLREPDPEMIDQRHPFLEVVQTTPQEIFMMDLCAHLFSMRWNETLLSTWLRFDPQLVWRDLEKFDTLYNHGNITASCLFATKIARRIVGSTKCDQSSPYGNWVVDEFTDEVNFPGEKYRSTVPLKDDPLERFIFKSASHDQAASRSDRPSGDSSATLVESDLDDSNEEASQAASDILVLAVIRLPNSHSTSGAGSAQQKSKNRKKKEKEKARKLRRQQEAVGQPLEGHIPAVTIDQREPEQREATTPYSVTTGRESSVQEVQPPQTVTDENESESDSNPAGDLMSIGNVFEIHEESGRPDANGNACRQDLTTTLRDIKVADSTIEGDVTESQEPNQESVGVPVSPTQETKDLQGSGTPKGGANQDNKDDKESTASDAPYQSPAEVAESDGLMAGIHEYYKQKQMYCRLMEEPGLAKRFYKDLYQIHDNSEEEGPSEDGMGQPTDDADDEGEQQDYEDSRNPRSVHLDNEDVLIFRWRGLQAAREGARQIRKTYGKQAFKTAKILYTVDHRFRLGVIPPE